MMHAMDASLPSNSRYCQLKRELCLAHTAGLDNWKTGGTIHLLLTRVIVTSEKLLFYLLEQKSKIKVIPKLAANLKVDID